MGSPLRAFAFLTGVLFSTNACSRVLGFGPNYSVGQAGSDGAGGSPDASAGSGGQSSGGSSSDAGGGAGVGASGGTGGSSATGGVSSGGSSAGAGQGGTSASGGSSATGGASSGDASPGTSLHYAANGNFDSSGTYLPGAFGFNIADVSSVGVVNTLPSGVLGLVWVSLCNGADSAFQAAIQPFIGNAKVFGFYLMDDPDPATCPQANLKAESDWIHANDPGAKTFIILEVQTASSNPSYANTYNPANSDIDLYGLDPYPCRSELNGCDDTYITKAVAAAISSGVPQQDIVPVFQAFGGGSYVDDGGGSYLLPTAAQETQILATWATVVSTPVFDYVYSWGSQSGDTALASSSALQQVFAQHNK